MEGKYEYKTIRRIDSIERVALTPSTRKQIEYRLSPLNGISRKLVNASYKEWARCYCRGILQVTERFGLRS